MSSETNFRSLTIDGALGAKLATRLDLPAGPLKAVALFAHCFTCGKDILAARTIAKRLSERGIAVARFDFTGLGSSEGEFASTNFSSNVGDLVSVAEVVAEEVGAPSLLIGHSLGGAAVLVAAAQIPSVRAVATIGAPSDAEHVTHNFAADLDAIAADGEARVSLGGRPFTIRQSFVDDLKNHKVTQSAASLKAALLVAHAPLDATVGISNATDIFVAAKHPKSFLSLDNADHLLSRRADSAYAADVIAAWAMRFVGQPDVQSPPVRAVDGVLASSAGGKFRTAITAGRHPIVADEPVDYGGGDTGPTPYDLAAAALAACTLMTMRLYAERKGFTVDATVNVQHDKVHAADCEACLTIEPDKAGRVDLFRRTIAFGAGHSAQEREKLLEIADKCPVHRTLERGAAVVTTGVDFG